jgi:hypothetical protein
MRSISEALMVAWSFRIVIGSFAVFVTPLLAATPSNLVKTTDDRVLRLRRMVDRSGDRQAIIAHLTSIAWNLTTITAHVSIITRPDAKPSQLAMAIECSQQAATEPHATMRSLRMRIRSTIETHRGSSRTPNRTDPSPMWTRSAHKRRSRPSE